MWSHSLLSQSVYCGAAGLNCKEMSVRDIAWVCVCVYVGLFVSYSHCEPKVIEADCATRAGPSGHGAAVQRAPACVQVCIYLHECAHSGLLAWDMTPLLVSVCVSMHVCMVVCKCVCPWSLGTVPSTRCAVGCVSWHGQSYARTLNPHLYPQLPSLQTQTLLHVDTCDKLPQIWLKR